MKPKVKLITQDEEDTVILEGFEGYIEKGKILFTINLAPPEPGFKDTYRSVRKDLVNQIKYLEKVVYLMNILGPKTEISGEFYWGEGDLLLELIIPTNHIVFKHLFKNKPK